MQCLVSQGTKITDLIVDKDILKTADPDHFNESGFIESGLGFTDI
jgi:hypothetical protein